MVISCHIWKVSVFDWSELMDLPLNPIGWALLVLLGALPEQGERSRGPLGPKRRRVLEDKSFFKTK